MYGSSLKLAWRVLLRRKFFTAVSLFGIGFTLLVLIMASAVLDNVLAPRAPETRLGRTLGIYAVELAGGGEPAQPNSASRIYHGFPGWRLLDGVVRDLPGVERVAITSTHRSIVAYVDGRKVRSYLKRTDGQFWQVLDFTFVEGAPYGDADEAAGRHVAVINETTRRRYFGAGATAVGRPLEADGQRFTVVGVVRDVPIVRPVPFADIWVPIASAKSSLYRQEVTGDFMALLLARSPADFAAIKSEVDARLRRFDIPDKTIFDRVSSGGADTLFEAAARIMRPGGIGLDNRTAARRLRGILLACALLFMLLPAVNLVNLNLSRILERAPEIGVRKAFGASSLSLTGQFLVENLVLTVLGGLLGFVLSAVVLAAINASGAIPYAEFSVNLRVFLYGLAAALVFGLLSGVYPAWRMSRMHPVQALRGRS